LKIIFSAMLWGNRKAGFYLGREGEEGREAKVRAQDVKTVENFKLQVIRDTKIKRRNFLTSALLLKMFLT